MKLRLTMAFAVLIACYSAGALAVGDPERGKGYYVTCGTCHGVNGEGEESLNAPALASQEDWYLIRQLQNFKSGVRGNNPRDTYGMMMAPMAQILPDEQAIEDVVAYILTLGD